MIKLIGWDVGFATKIVTQRPTATQVVDASKELEKPSNLTLFNPVLGK